MNSLLPRPIYIPVRSRRQQAGAMIIEFALVVLLFLTILIGIMEFGRWLFTLNAAAEATRWGARLAVVCGPQSTQTDIQRHIGVMIRSNGTLRVSYPPSTCATDCMVTVTLTGATFTPLIPLMPVPQGGWPMPDFKTTLPGEALGSAGGTRATNDVCPAAA